MIAHLALPPMWFETLTASVLNRVTRGRRATRPEGVLLGYAGESSTRPVIWADPQRTEHAVIVGKTGSGKTYLLERVALDLARRGEGFAFFDFHGDASRSLIARLRQLPDAETRLLVLDPSHPTRSPGLNVLASGPSEAERFRKVSELSSILRQRWGVDSFGARTEELLRNALFTLASNGLTLAQLPALLTDAILRGRCATRLDHPEVQAYWRDRYEPLSEAMKGAFREPLLNKVTGFLAEPAARHLLGQAESTVDVEAAMQAGAWLMIRLPKGRLREHAHTLGNLIFAHLQFAAFARQRLPRSARRPFTLLCDEVQNLAENDLALLLTEGRKFAISVMTANQFWEQLPRTLRGALLSAASHISFRVSSSDAHVLAAELSLDRQARVTRELTTLGRGEALARLGTAAVERFRVPALPVAPDLSDGVLEDLLVPITRLRADIDRRLRAPRPNDAVMPPGDGAPAEGHHGW